MPLPILVGFHTVKIPSQGCDIYEIILSTGMTSALSLALYNSQLTLGYHITNFYSNLSLESLKLKLLLGVGFGVIKRPSNSRHSC